MNSTPNTKMKPNSNSGCSYYNFNSANTSNNLNNINQKEIRINETDIEDIYEIIAQVKESIQENKTRMDKLEEFFVSRILSRVNDPNYTVEERKDNATSKKSKSANKSDGSNSKTKNQKSILNLGFLNLPPKVGDKDNYNTSESKNSTKEESERKNLMNKINVINLDSDPIMEVDNEEIFEINEERKEETMIIPLVNEDRRNRQDSESSENNSRSGSENEGKGRANLKSDTSSNLNTNFNAETMNKMKEKINLEDKHVNYNQKFFDYKSLHLNKEKEKEQANLKRKSEVNINDNPMQKKSKNDWIKKEIDTKNGTSIMDNNAKMGLLPNNLNLTSNSSISYISAGNNLLNPNPNTTNKSNITTINVNLTHLSDKKSNNSSNLTFETKSNNSSNINLNQPLPLPPMIQSNFNSEKKSDFSQLSLAFDSNVNSKDKGISNNFNNDVPHDEGKQSTKFAELLKMKKEKKISFGNKNLNVSRINEEESINDISNMLADNDGVINPKPADRIYELDLHTLEDTHNEFYEIKPKKRNPFLPNDPKNREYKNLNNTNNRNFKYSVNVGNVNNIRNKKEREKMNGYKCEICENVSFNHKFNYSKFYEILGDRSEDICQTCSRHRTTEDPNRTPKGFYETSI